MIKFTIRLYSDISPQTNKLSSLFEEIYHLYIRSNIDYGNLTIIKISIYDYIIISCSILLYFHCDDEASSQSRFGKKAPTRGSVALFCVFWENRICTNPCANSPVSRVINYIKNIINKINKYFIK